MDKSTLSNYGWIVIAVLVLSVMIALATPFGSYIKTGIENTTQGLFDTSEKALNVVGMSAGEGTFGPKMLEGDGQVLNAKKPVAFSFRSSAPVDTFKAVKVDGETVSSENYTVTEGSTIVTFTEQYAQTLAVGSHTVEIVSNDGYGEKSATATFTVNSPLTTLTAKTWNGVNESYISGDYVWTDGENTYCQIYSQAARKYYHYVLNGDTWEEKTWNNVPANFYGSNIWTDGTNTYYSKGSTQQYVLQGDTWVAKTWSGFRYISGSNIWTDGTNTYYSSVSDQYILNGDTWEEKTWNGLENFSGSGLCGDDVWTDGTNIYYSSYSNQYVLNGDTWQEKTWNGLTDFNGMYIWTDGTNTYYSSGSNQYVLQGDTWEEKTWDGLTSFSGNCVWTDGTNYYYSSSTKQYIFS